MTTLWTGSPLGQGEFTTLPAENDRAVEDLMEGERRLRSIAEGTARELQQVLIDLAVRFDGVRLEELRRKAPSIPASWTAADWRKFFAAVRPQAASSWLDAEAIQQEREALAVQIASLQAELAASRKAKLLPRPEAEAAPAPVSVTIPAVVADLPQGFTPPIAGLLADVKAIMPGLPKICPAEFHKALDGNGRTGGDLAKAYQRYWIGLYLVGRWGISSMFLVDDVQAQTGGVSGGAGSLRRVLDNLVDAKILGTQKLELALSKTRSSLKLARLTTDGKRLYKALFGNDPAETDWERLDRLHEGARFPEHTLAVLIFALHACKRGWATQILPPVEGTNSVPDLAVKRGDQTLYVEVELSKKESPTKWRNQAELNGGKVALCAATPESRKRLVGDCHLDHLSGQATDLETLVKVKYQIIDESTRLWIEEW